MVHPIKIIQELRSKRAYIASQNEAIAMFDAQKGAIEAIANTEGFKEIKLFWYRQWEAALARLETIKSDDVADHKSVEAELRQAKAFIDFLSNLLEQQSFKLPEVDEE